MLSRVLLTRTGCCCEGKVEGVGEEGVWEAGEEVLQCTRHIMYCVHLLVDDHTDRVWKEMGGGGGTG